VNKATVIVVIIFCTYGTLAYLAFGDSESQIVFELLPKDTFVKALTALNVMVLMATYPLTIFPANDVLEGVTIRRCMKSEDRGLKYWLINLSRLLVCLSAAYCGLNLKNVLDKFLGVLGAVGCAPLALIIPTLCHLVTVAETKAQKVEDLFLVGISIAVMICCVTETFSNL